MWLARGSCKPSTGQRPDWLQSLNELETFIRCGLRVGRESARTLAQLHDNNRTCQQPPGEFLKWRLHFTSRTRPDVLCPFARSIVARGGELYASSSSLVAFPSHCRIMSGQAEPSEAVPHRPSSSLQIKSRAHFSSTRSRSMSIVSSFLCCHLACSRPERVKLRSSSANPNCSLQISGSR